MNDPAGAGTSYRAAGLISCFERLRRGRDVRPRRRRSSTRSARPLDTRCRRHSAMNDPAGAGTSYRAAGLISCLSVFGAGRTSRPRRRRSSTRSARPLDTRCRRQPDRSWRSGAGCGERALEPLRSHHAAARRAVHGSRPGAWADVPLRAVQARQGAARSAHAASAGAAAVRLCGVRAVICERTGCTHRAKGAVAFQFFPPEAVMRFHGIRTARLRLHAAGRRAPARLRPGRMESAEAFRAAVLLWCASGTRCRPRASRRRPRAGQPRRLRPRGEGVAEGARRRAARLGAVLGRPAVPPSRRGEGERGMAAKLEQRWRTECARIKKHNQRHNLSLEPPEFDAWLEAGCPQGHAAACPRGQAAPSPGTHPVSRSCPSGKALQGTGRGTGTGTGTTQRPVKRLTDKEKAAVRSKFASLAGLSPDTVGRP
jgi:hypothetical protein